MPSYTLFRSIATLIALVAGLLVPVAGHAVNFDNTKIFDFSGMTAGQELGCLAMNIYHEGRGESSQGQAAIAAVTMNRVHSKRYPNTVCKVVWQPKQFSWTRIAPRHFVIKDQNAWEESLIIADLFMHGAKLAEIGEATNYHSVSVQPNWMDNSRLIGLVGNHYFYAL
jgi:spore germination cell wall hydrolase CwlJ-like protein